MICVKGPCCTVFLPFTMKTTCCRSFTYFTSIAGEETMALSSGARAQDDEEDRPTEATAAAYDTAFTTRRGPRHTPSRRTSSHRLSDPCDFSRSVPRCQDHPNPYPKVHLGGSGHFGADPACTTACKAFGLKTASAR